MDSHLIIECVVTAAKLSGVDVDRQEIAADDLPNLLYTVEGRTSLSGEVQVLTFTGIPFRVINAINLLSAAVGTPCRVRYDAANTMQPFLLYDMQEVFLFEDCEGAAAPGGVGSFAPAEGGA